MQERVVDARPTWNLTTEEHISANYYPINSAIAILDPDTKLQMTVMNDRSQGGSSTVNGRLELMQNRRLFHDDDRGVGEPLNETTMYNYGIQVHATYHFQLFNRSTEPSCQRIVQILVDEPLQYYFAFNWTNTTSAASLDDFQENLLSLSAWEKLISDFSLTYALPDAVKANLFPMSRNNILVRVENIGDNFDTPASSNRTFYVKLKDYAAALYQHVNSGKNAVLLNHINVNEMSLTGNQPYSDMLANKIHWRGADDATVPAEPVWPQDRGQFEIAL